MSAGCGRFRDRRVARGKPGHPPDIEGELTMSEQPDCASVLGMRDEVSCQELVGSLDSYLAGELPPERRTVFDRHLAACLDCRNYLDSYRKTIALGREALRGRHDAEIPAELILAILAARGE
jgi:anti-sigma factor RsiW